MIKLKNTTTEPQEKFTKKECEKKLEIYKKKLYELQNVFFADARFSILIILQGLDTSGKDSTIRHVLSCMNPMGVQVKAFKVPTEEELKHDFLWRAYPHFPAKGMIEVFNRSYYEDIIVKSIQQKLSKKCLQQNCNIINELEKHLEANGTKILKFFFHISQDEQRKRLKERISSPHKQWKYDKNDELVADKWNDYVNVYDTIFTKCNVNKWHVIPSNKRWYRDFIVAKMLTEQLEELQLKYPEAKK